FSSRRRHTRCYRDWSSDVCSSDLRFYWGETGNVNTPALFTIPIASSRAAVPTGYGYVLPDQNGWSRYLHFQSAWVLIMTGLLYVAVGFSQGHFRQNLLPALSDVSVTRLAISIAQHLRFAMEIARRVTETSEIGRAHV